MRIEAGVVVEKPLGHIFRSLSNVESWPAWSTAVVSTWWVSGDPMSAGATFAETTRFLGRSIEQRHEVMEYDPPHRFAFKAITGPFRQSTRFSFVQEAAGTRVTLLSEGDTGSFLRPLKPLFERIGQRQLEKELQGFKVWAEEGDGGNG